VLRDNADIAIGLAALVLVNVVVLGYWSQLHRTERRYLATLRQLDGEIHALQSRNPSQDEWGSLRARVTGTLAPVVDDLKKTASASAPIRQHLLGAARDQLPRLVAPRSAEMKEPERLYEQHMRFVEQELARE
jgi:hypothetical protein